MNPYVQQLIDRLNRSQAYKDVFLADTESARLVLRDLMKEADPRHKLFIPGHADITANNLGARDLAAGMLRLIFGNDADLRKQISENYNQENQTQ